jgi:FdhD protein
MVGKSRPTAFATEIGKTLNMTIACTDNESGLIVFCGENRIIF